MEDSGDAAFNRIVTRYYAKILKFCAYTLGMGLAEDCTQDIFLILYENMDRLNNYDNIGGWLYKTADNISKRYAASVRKERKKRAAPAENAEDGAQDWADSLAAKTIRGEEEAAAEEQAIALAAAGIGKRLKPNDEQILELAFRQKRPLKEVAARLGLSMSAVKSRSSRLRHKISALARELLAD
jgi:RNA polymerase sigma-70 factor (ECF subfamily)